MTEALTAMIDHMFGSVQLNRIEALIETTNEGSIRLVEKLGFKREGLLRENACFHGKINDDFLYALLRRDWDARHLSRVG